MMDRGINGLAVAVAAHAAAELACRQAYRDHVAAVERAAGQCGLETCFPRMGEIAIKRPDGAAMGIDELNHFQDALAQAAAAILEHRRAAEEQRQQAQAAEDARRAQALAAENAAAAAPYRAARRLRQQQKVAAGHWKAAPTEGAPP